MKKIVFVSLVTFFGAGVLFGSNYPFIPNLNEELEHNKMAIKEYSATIEQLKKRNNYLKEVQQANPSLYIKKPLYEALKDRYIYRVKLGGAKAEAMNMTLKDHTISLEMSLKVERSEKGSYFMSSRNFYQQFSIPSDADEKKITNRVAGDYFEIIIPKKK
jgi:HSP20 family molecular chaperone IbpA